MDSSYPQYGSTNPQYGHGGVVNSYDVDGSYQMVDIPSTAAYSQQDQNVWLEQGTSAPWNPGRSTTVSQSAPAQSVYRGWRSPQPDVSGSVATVPDQPMARAANSVWSGDAPITSQSDTGLEHSYDTTSGAGHVTKRRRASFSRSTGSSSVARSKKSNVSLHNNAPFACPASGCGQVFRIQSDLTKHALTHDRPFRCRTRDCEHSEKGFTTRNDLERHEWNLHAVLPRSGKAPAWECAYEGCDKTKPWARVDNFRAHVKRMHTSLDREIEDIIERSKLDFAKASTGRTIVTNYYGIVKEVDEANFDFSTKYISFDKLPNVTDDSTYAFMPAVTSSVDGHSQWSDHKSKSPLVHAHQHQTIASATPSTMPTSSAPSEQSSYTSPSQISGHVKSYTRGDTLSRPKRGGGEELYDTTQLLTIPHRSGLSNQVSARRKSEPGGSQSNSLKAHVKHIGSELAVGKMTIEAYSKYIDRLFENYDIRRVKSESRFVSEHRNEVRLNTIHENGGHGMPNTMMGQGMEMEVDGFNYSSMNDMTMANPMLDPKENRTQQMATDLGISDGGDGKLQMSFTTTQGDYGGSIYGTGYDASTMSSAASQSGRQYGCTKPDCSATFTTNSALEKHKRRHLKPYYCTHEDCASDKKFGSKNDWKRHEQKQHRIAPYWKCIFCNDAPRYDLLMGMTEHLSIDHELSTSELTEDARRCLVDLAVGTYWCGFCREVLQTSPIQAADERFNHISTHFHPHHQHIHDWLLPDGLSTKGEKEMRVEEEVDDDEASSTDDEDDDSTGTAVFDIEDDTSSVVDISYEPDKFTAMNPSFGSRYDNDQSLDGLTPTAPPNVTSMEDIDLVPEPEPPKSVPLMFNCCQCQMEYTNANMTTRCLGVLGYCEHTFCNECYRTARVCSLDNDGFYG